MPGWTGWTVTPLAESEAWYTDLRGKDLWYARTPCRWKVGKADSLSCGLTHRAAKQFFETLYSRSADSALFDAV